MRHVPVLGGLLGAVALAPLLAVPEPSAPGSPEHPAAALKAAAAPAGPAGAAGRRLIAYRGLRLPVPEGWAVHRLDQDPNRCVRYDRRAIYLGTPGAAQDCPSRVIGGAEVLVIEPSAGNGTKPSARRAPVRIDRLSRFTVKETADHRTRVAVPEAGVVISGSYGPDPSVVEDLIRSTELDVGWNRDRDSDPPPEHDGPGPDPGDGHGPAPKDSGEPSEKPSEKPSEEPAPRDPEPTEKPEETDGEKPWAIGKGFDTCTAPSIKAMRAWRRAYGIANMYIGGASRGCAQPNLNRKWVRSVRKMGYRLIPTYVGLQAPCSRYRTHFTAKNASRQGRLAAVDAVRKAKALGIPEGRPIYFDMESYDGRKAACRKAVIRFLHSWSKRIKAERYEPGVYSSVTSAIRDLVRARGIVQPSAIWFAHWNGKKALYGHPLIPDDRWHPHRRIKQYRGGHKETHGGVTINIDSNNVDGLVH